MGVPVLALFRENKIRESQYYSVLFAKFKSLEIYALYGNLYSQSVLVKQDNSVHWSNGTQNKHP